MRSTNSQILLVTLFTCGLFTIKCGTNLLPTATPSKAINIAAAANLAVIIDELTDQFSASNGIQTVVSLGSTTSLAHQIENGAPFDIFVSADTEHVDHLIELGLLVAESRRIYARGKLVVLTTSVITDLQDLTAPAIKVIAVPKPEVAPYGRATVDAIKRLNLWSSLKPKIVYAQNVAMSKQFLRSGNADAAFTANSLINANDMESSITLPIAKNLHRPIDQALGIIATSTQQEAVKIFAAFLLSKEVQSLLVTRGYRPAPQRQTTTN